MRSILILLTLAFCVGCDGEFSFQIKTAPKSQPSPTKATEIGAAKVEELTR